VKQLDCFAHLAILPYEFPLCSCQRRSDSRVEKKRTVVPDVCGCLLGTEVETDRPSELAEAAAYEHARTVYDRVISECAGEFLDLVYTGSHSDRRGNMRRLSRRQNSKASDRRDSRVLLRFVTKLPKAGDDWFIFRFHAQKGFDSGNRMFYASLDFKVLSASGVSEFFPKSERPSLLNPDRQLTRRS
jgi:hypothetical protein